MNSVAYLHYVGPMPPREMYGYENFSVKRKEQFDIWYTSQENVTFDNAKQLLNYCIMDVLILKKGCLKFMKTFIDLLNVNPFLEAVTMPSALMLGFWKNFLRPNTLGIVPRNEYAGNKKQSQIGRKWLEFENRKVNNRRQFEYKLPRVGVYVDGFLESNDPAIKSRVYEMWGCHWHLCPHCYNRNPVSYGLSDNLKRESVNRRVERIVAAGYEVVQEWECVFRKVLKLNPQL